MLALAGETDWQTAAVIGVHELFTIFQWECIGYDWGIFHQPLYFQLPINMEYTFNSGITKVESAAYLHDAFRAFDVWYQRNNPCTKSSSALTSVLYDYIQDEFESHGGKVNINPPLGFNGPIKLYQSSFAGYGNCQ